MNDARPSETTPNIGPAPQRRGAVIAGVAGGVLLLALTGTSVWSAHQNAPRLKEERLELSRKEFDRTVDMATAPVGIKLVSYTRIKDGCLVVEVTKKWFDDSRDHREQFALSLRDGWARLAGYGDDVSKICFRMVDAEGRSLARFDASNPNMQFDAAF